MKPIIQKLRSQTNLSAAEIEDVMHQIMEGGAASADIAEFLLALREKGPTVEEITGAARIMRRRSGVR